MMSGLKFDLSAGALHTAAEQKEVHELAAKYNCTVVILTKPAPEVTSLRLKTSHLGDHEARLRDLQKDILAKYA